MFTWIGKQGARSCDGFEVQSIDRFSVAYREGTQVVTVYVESNGNGMMEIARDAFSHWDNLRITNPPEKQAKMRENFVSAMQFQGITLLP